MKKEKMDKTCSLNEQADDERLQRLIDESVMTFVKEYKTKNTEYIELGIDSSESLIRLSEDFPETYRFFFMERSSRNRQEDMLIKAVYRKGIEDAKTIAKLIEFQKEDIEKQE